VVVYPREVSVFPEADRKVVALNLLHRGIDQHGEAAGGWEAALRAL
jgi:hypothetical protein